jgi:hypothetical protein
MDKPVTNETNVWERTYCLECLQSLLSFAMVAVWLSIKYINLGHIHTEICLSGIYKLPPIYTILDSCTWRLFKFFPSGLIVSVQRKKNQTPPFVNQYMGQKLDPFPFDEFTSFTPAPASLCFSYAGLATPSVESPISARPSSALSLLAVAALRRRKKTTRKASRARRATTPTATPTPTPTLAPVLRLLWLTEALVSADVGEEEGPEGVRVAVGLVMR